MPALANQRANIDLGSAAFDELVFGALRDPFAAIGHRLESARVDFDPANHEMKLMLKLLWIGSHAGPKAEGLASSPKTEVQDIEFKETQSAQNL